MSALLALILLQSAAPAADTQFVCEKRDGKSFTVTATTAAAPDAADQAYRALFGTDLRDDLATPDAVVNGLPDMLSLIWEPEDGSETTLDLLDYIPETGQASYRLHRRSSAAEPIVTTTFFEGHCRMQGAGTRESRAGGRTAQ